MFNSGLFCEDMSILFIIEFQGLIYLFHFRSIRVKERSQKEPMSVAFIRLVGF